LVSSFENQLIMQTPTKSNIPKIISGIVATTILILLLRLLLPSFWFWVAFEIFAALLVASGCCGEWWLHHHPAGRRKKEQDEHHKIESKFIAMVSLGVIMELFALGNSIREGAKLEGEVSDAKERASSNEVQVAELNSNNLVLSSNVLELAHLYDQSTNALAEAQARLAAIRPLKERLAETLKAIDPQIIPALKTNSVVTAYEEATSQFLSFSLQSLAKEPGAEKYIVLTVDPVFIFTTKGTANKLKVEAKHALVEP
jgi:hypothetical protein